MRSTRYLIAALAAVAAVALPHPTHATHPHDALVHADSVAADSTLSLPALERWVLARNPSLEAARQAVAAMRKRPAMEGALMDPEVEFGLGASSIGNQDLGTAYRIGVKQMIPCGRGVGGEET